MLATQLITMEMVAHMTEVQMIQSDLELAKLVGVSKFDANLILTT